jgi:hypothetical protein
VLFVLSSPERTVGLGLNRLRLGAMDFLENPGSLEILVPRPRADRLSARLIVWESGHVSEFGPGDAPRQSSGTGAARVIGAEPGRIFIGVDQNGLVGVDTVDLAGEASIPVRSGVAASLLHLSTAQGKDFGRTRCLWSAPGVAETQVSLRWPAPGSRVGRPLLYRVDADSEHQAGTGDVVQVFRAGSRMGDPIETFASGGRLERFPQRLRSGPYWLLCEETCTLRFVNLRAPDRDPIISWLPRAGRLKARRSAEIDCLLWRPDESGYRGGPVSGVVARWLRSGIPLDSGVSLLVLTTEDDGQTIRVEKATPDGTRSPLAVGPLGHLRLSLRSELDFPLPWAKVRVDGPWISEGESLLLSPTADGIVDQPLPGGTYSISVSATYHAKISASIRIDREGESNRTTDLVLELD